jgi:hypothetical protein
LRFLYLFRTVCGMSDRLCAARRCAEPVQSERGTSPYCAPHARLVADFARWLDSTLVSPPGSDLLPAYLSFDAAREQWSLGHTNLRSIP